jgi:drug/metabolite transporter (DMT)-like permease
VINFLSPMLAAFAIAVLLRAPFTRMQRIAGLLSFFGVILIAKPWHIVWQHEVNCIMPSTESVVAAATAASPTLAVRDAMPTPTVCPDEVIHRPSPLEHALAIGVALIGALGGAGGFITLSWIGTDAHPLISVSYFATATTLFSGLSFLLQPEAAFNWPTDPAIWALLGLQGTVSFLMQALQAASLAAERSSRALNMVYSQVVFALIVDKIAWGTTPGPVSIMGGLTVLGSVFAVAITREGAAKSVEDIEAEDRPIDGGGDEEMQLMAKEESEDSDDDWGVAEERKPV